ncbi:SAM-dependent methyltransferase [Sphingobium sp. B7D2B]|uniref:class I SAM-dependent methyltransferase n=1 Tax=Sphingobium sp. B7D2B TaxID=2940583 RepID=UPI0022247698|nr:class I SAM-dependent methyltransferase [Sphingobium sp. B7D2B]MCW2366815.1 SAM-dependent methyltransferase [Sphingobium sp. B7D2B]
MSKQAEQGYLSLIGEAGRTHSLEKPFSNHDCGLTLASIGSVMTLMPPVPAMVLDLGCGSGWTSVFFAKHGYHVVGQDIAEDMIELANMNKAASNLGDELMFVESDYEDLPHVDLFDCAVFFDSLHHAENTEAALRSAYTALKPGGVLVTHEPGDGHSTAPWSVQAMEIYGVTERDMPPRVIMDHARRVGFTDFRIHPMQHDLHSLFYGRKHPLFSRAGMGQVKRVLQMLFGNDTSSGSIMVMRK